MQGLGQVRLPEMRLPLACARVSYAVQPEPQRVAELTKQQHGDGVMDENDSEADKWFVTVEVCIFAISLTIHDLGAGSRCYL